MPSNRLISLRVRVAWLTFVACVLASTAARADAEQSRALDFDVAADVSGCGDAQSFGESVAAHLGYNPFLASDPSTTKGSVRTRIRSKGSLLVGTVELLDESGKTLGAKSLESARCEDLLAAMSFAVGMAIDPSRTLHAGAATTPATPPVVPAPATKPPEKSSDDESAANSRANEAPQKKTARDFRVEPQLALGGGVTGLGPAAGVAGVFYAGAGARYGAASLEIEGRYSSPSSQNVTGGKVTTSTIGASLVPCAHLGLAFLCAQIFVGALDGQAEGIQNQQGGTTFFSQAGVRAGVSIPLGASFALEPFVDGLVTLTPTTLKFLNVDVWSADAVGLTGGIRLVLHFP